MNAKCCLTLEKASKYAQKRVVFGRPIGQNQGLQYPLAAAYTKLEAAKLDIYHAARICDESRKRTDIGKGAIWVACHSAKYIAAEPAFTGCEQSVRHCQ